MTKPLWWKWEVTPGNVISWISSIIAIVVVIVLLQSDVKALKADTERQDRRITRIEERQEKANETISEMRGDIRVIRQILEQARGRQ